MPTPGSIEFDKDTIAVLLDSFVKVRIGKDEDAFVNSGLFSVNLSN